MKKLLLILVGICLLVAGCSGGGKSGSDTGGTPQTAVIDLNTSGEQPVNLLYQTPTTAGSSVKITMVLRSIEVMADKKLKVNCEWSAQNFKPDLPTVKLSDKDKKCANNDKVTAVYLLDNNNKTYNHVNGSGAAYAEVNLNEGTKTGSFYFQSLASGVTSFYYCDYEYSKKLGPIYIKGVSGNTANNGAMVKKTVEQYFTGYFDSQKNLTFSKMGDIMQDNDNTQLEETFRETLIDGQRQFDTGIRDYRYQINYQNIDISGDTAKINLVLNLDYHYMNDPSRELAKIYGVKYSFVMKNLGTRWAISQIDSDLEEFSQFKDKVAEKIKQSPSLNRADAIRDVGQSLRNNTRMIRQNSAYLRGNASAVPSLSERASENNAIDRSIYIACKKYTYNPDNAVKYAKAYACAPVNERLFTTCKDYRGEVDCTNFASQCVWAGYGGYVDGNKAQSKYNIEHTIGMVKSEWNAGMGGATSKWSGVKELFEFLMSSKIAGPNGITDYPNDYNRQRLYTETPAASIKVGDVLQFWYDNVGYGHSVFVTEKYGPNYDQIYIASHTNNKWHQNLMVNINQSRGMRRITPSVTAYLK